MMFLLLCVALLSTLSNADVGCFIWDGGCGNYGAVNPKNFIRDNLTQEECYSRCSGGQYTHYFHNAGNGFCICMGSTPVSCTQSGGGWKYYTLEACSPSPTVAVTGPPSQS